MVLTLLAVANGEAKDFKIKDVKKLYRVAGYLNIEFEGRQVNDVAKDVALRFLDDYSRQEGRNQLYGKGSSEDTGEMEESGA